LQLVRLDPNIHMWVDMDVQPRTVSVWNWNSASHAYYRGTSQCGHVGVAVDWNKYSGF
jgi:hypothetical protein